MDQKISIHFKSNGYVSTDLIQVSGDYLITTDKEVSADQESLIIVKKPYNLADIEKIVIVMPAEHRNMPPEEPAAEKQLLTEESSQ